MHAVSVIAGCNVRRQIEVLYLAVLLVAKTNHL